MALSTQAQRAEASRKQRASSLSSPASPRSVSSSQVFPDTLPAGTEYGADNGIRLEAVWLTHDPAYPDEQPTAPLARYTYTAGGELRAVYDRSGTQVRGFTYDAEHAGRMVAHHYAGRPESCYRYDDTGRVTEQVNPEGLDYRFEYGESRVIITDSLNRREVLYTEGEGGLKRVVKKEHADGSITRSEYDEAGRLKAQTDAAGIIAEQKKEPEMTVRYYISSADLTAEKFATAIRNHWHVENKLHWRLDVVMNEDDCKIRRGNAAELFSGIRHITINILTNDKVFKAGLRRKMRKAAMDRNYLASVLAGSGLS
ncbi:ISAs1 family transposase [Shigella sonnei]|uniref:ISAs1 family transposase n=1 Tax=Shigella sonnei TaxID=624 RepID=UPI0030C85FCE